MSRALRLTLIVALSGGLALLSGSLRPLGLRRAAAQEEQLTSTAVQGLAKRLLGQPRPAVEALIGDTSTEEEGWVRYGQDLSLRYEEGRCVRLRIRVPDRLSCGEAAAWVGYPARRGSGFPLRRPGRCDWPGQSLRHRLATGVVGALDLPSGVFELWLAPAPGPTPTGQ